MNLKSFLRENAEVVNNQKVVISERFKDDKGKPIPFEIRALSEKEVEQLRKACIKRVKVKKGSYDDELDSSLLATKMIIESVVYPPLKSEELQKSYGVFGAEELVQAMFISGEYSNLRAKVQEVSGYGVDLDEMVEEAKN